MPGTEELRSLWMSAAEAEELGIYIAAELGCPDPSTGLEYLRRLPVERLLPYSSIFTRYVYGNTTMPLAPEAALRTGTFQRVPVLSGSTRDEARLYVGLFYELAGQPVTAEHYPQLLTAAFGRAADQVAVRYPLAAYASPALAWSALITDRVWALAIYQQNQLLATYVPTYAYMFADRDAPANVPFPSDLPPGAYHNAEVIYQFDLAGQAAPLTAAQWELAEQINRYWGNFARNGDPNGSGLPNWQRWESNASIPYVQALAPGKSGIRAIDYIDEHHLAFWLRLKGDPLP